MIRLFAAIDLPVIVRERVGMLCAGLPGAKWISEEQIHLTLRFIGEVDGVIFREIKEALAGVRTEVFDLQLKGLGTFPPRKKPRVLWVGVEKNEPLVQLRNRIESALVACGLEPEGRKFAPHITLARLRDTPLTRLTNFLAGNSMFSCEPFMVDEFHLYSSVLTPKGAIHQLEESYSLAG